MSSKKPVLGVALDRDPSGRLARISPPDPHKQMKLGKRELPQLPSVPPSRMRKTVVPR